MEQEDTDKEKTFIVTQLINPNHFNLYNPYLRNIEARKVLEDNLKNEIKLFESNKQALKKGDNVAYDWQEGERYIRCVIDDIKIFNDVTYYLLYSLDYGVSIYTTTLNDIHVISELNGFMPSPIMSRISLPVLPSMAKFDYLSDKQIIVFDHTWSDLALNIFRECLSKAALITFEPSTDLPGHDGFMFGDLIITSFYGIKFSLAQTLINENVAKKASSPKEFFKYFDRLSTKNIERWNDNSKTGGILKMPEGKLPLYYEDEVCIKEYILNCESVKNKISSVQKVIEWQSKIKGFENLSASDYDETDDGWENMAVGNQIEEIDVCSLDIGDEGFCETIINNKRKAAPMVDDTKKSKEDGRVTVVNVICQSISQIYPHSEKFMLKGETSNANN